MISGGFARARHWLLEGGSNALLVGALISLPFLPFTDGALLDRAVLVLIYAMFATGLNVAVNLCGLIDLGYAAFIAIGAYGTALLSRELGLNIWACLPLSGALAACAALILGSVILRARGEYFALATLAFSLIVQEMLVRWAPLTGGAIGLTVTPRAVGALPFVPAADFSYAAVLAAWAVLAHLVWRLRRLHWGRAWEAVNADAAAACSLGIGPFASRLSGYVFGAAVAGLAGALFSAHQGTVRPGDFSFSMTATVLVIVHIGGRLGQKAIVPVAAVLAGVPAWLPTLAPFFPSAAIVAAVVLLLWRPRGLGRRIPVFRAWKLRPEGRS